MTSALTFDARPAATAWSRLMGLADGGLVHAEQTSGVVCGRARLHGVETAVFATDPAVQGGALGGPACRAIADTITSATRDGVPVVGVWHCGGAKLQDGVASLDGMGRVFAAATAASGRVPQLSVVLGTAAGGAAYGSALSDVVITGPDARLFVTGPAVVREVTGEDVDAEALGGPGVHSQRSGLAHVAAASEQAALDTARTTVSLLMKKVGSSVAAIAPDPALHQVLPERRRRAYDVHPLIERVLDRDVPPLELHARWAPNIVTSLGRLGGRTVGVLANNPLRLGGCLDGRASDKAARFVQMCDSLGIALVVLVDVPGYLPGVQQEWDGIIRRGSKLLHAFAQARVPRVTLITRKAYGGAYIAMNSRSLGADAVLAWPTAEIAVMGPEAAAQVVHRRALAAVPEQDRPALLAELVRAHPPQDGLRQAVEIGAVDRIIDPAETRAELIAALSAGPAQRGHHGNIQL